MERNLKGKGYKNLEIYNLAHGLALKVHNMSLTLPKYEMYEEGSQVRRSSKSVSSNIVEGYALRKYKAEFIRYLFRGYASSLETIEHLELLYETKSLKNEGIFSELTEGYTKLNKKLFSFIRSVDQKHISNIFSTQ